MLDCGGLALVVLRSLGVIDLEVLGYSSRPNGIDFENFLAQEAEQIPNESTLPGDIVAFDYGHGIQHIGIVTEVTHKIKMIHARPRGGVVEQFMHGHELRSWTSTWRLTQVKR